MKKQILLLCALLSVGQYCSAVNTKEVKDAQEYLTSIKDFFQNDWSLSNKLLPRPNYASIERCIDIIAQYAVENNKDILGNKDESLIQAASSLTQVSNNIIGTITMLQAGGDYNDALNSIPGYLKELTTTNVSISRYYKTISKQPAQKALQNAISTLILILNAIVHGIPTY